MQAEQYEVAWHGAAWRDDHAIQGAVSTPPAPATSPIIPAGPRAQPHHVKRGGRKPVIADAVADLLRTSERALSPIEIYGLIKETIHVPCTVAGVSGAIWRLKQAGKVERAERLTTFGEYGATYRWIPQSLAAFANVPLRPTRAEIGRLGGLAAAANRRADASR